MSKRVDSGNGGQGRVSWRGLALLGVAPNVTSHGEKWISGLGAVLALLVVYEVSAWYLGPLGVTLMVASMGASAVLLFAVPHGNLSQPWSVLAGHLLSAAIGVTCQRWFGGGILAPALAAGAAVVAMHYCRCLHPPGGATALAAVIGGPDIHALGYHYLLTPILVNVATILAVAVLFNGLFPWRRYPAVLVHRHSDGDAGKVAGTDTTLTHEDLAAAMEQLNSYIDVSSEDLAELFELAQAHARQQDEHPQHILVGGCYSNGQAGSRWCVRQVLDASGDERPGRDKVIYKNVAGAGLYSTGICTTAEFRQWARYPVVQQGERWVRITR